MLYENVLAAYLIITSRERYGNVPCFGANVNISFYGGGGGGGGGDQGAEKGLNDTLFN